MASYKLTRRDRKFISGLGKYFALNPEDHTPEKINEENNKPVDKKLARRYLLKCSGNISTQTFVIPVSSGAVTGYLFVNRDVSDMSGLAPLIVYFHGGGWIHGNMDFYSIYLKHLAQETDSNILLIDYHLAPKFKFPTAIEDCYDALIWAIDGAKYWKIDPDRIYIAGDGAGANLAAVASILLRDRKGPSVAGQILLYPIVDCRLRTQSMMEYKDSPTLNDKMLNFYVKCYAREPKDILSPMFSPLLSPDLSRLPEALIIAAERDPLSDDAKLYGQALSEAGTKSNVLIAQDAFNGFMPFKHASGRVASESAIWQFVNGRPVDHIRFLSKRELRHSRVEESSRNNVGDNEGNES